MYVTRCLCEKTIGFYFQQFITNDSEVLFCLMFFRL